MDTKFPPVPWLTDRNSVHAGQIAIIHLNDGENWVEIWTDKWCEGEGLTPEVMEANARLISSAPELLAALQVLVENGGIGPESMFHDARAAIDKATGAA